MSSKHKGDGLPEILAEVETTGCLSLRHSPLEYASEVMRKPADPSSASRFDAMPRGLSYMMVSGLTAASINCHAASGTSLTNCCSIPSEATNDSMDLESARFLILKIRSTASGLVASQPSPQIVSVG